MFTKILAFGAFLLLGISIGYLIRLFSASKSRKTLEDEARLMLEGAKKKEEEAKEKEEEIKEKEKKKLDELKKLEERFLHKEEFLEERDKAFLSKERDLEKKKTFLEERLNLISGAEKKIQNELARVAGISSEDAKAELFKKVESSHKEELIKKVQELEREKREEIEKRSVGIITGAIQRYSRSHVSELTTTAYNLPNEEIMGKIIGKEGRNIRAFERATGVELITDETPDIVIISSFDPMRREIARIALDKLIKDGRIQPAKIDEKVEEAKQDLEKRTREIGEQAVLDVGIINLPEDIIILLGKLYFRTSYGQNVLVHSIETAHIAGMLATELGLDVDTAKKAALLHDIGKVLSHEVEGTHTEIGRKLLKKYGIDEKIIKAIEPHHGEYPFSTSESFIIAASDTLSASRPGARRDSIENYLKRLENLEKIAMGFAGVKNAYALSAGREVRVFVVPEKIDDFGAFQLAKDVANKIQTELKYPGEIKINVIREIKAVEYAK